VFFFPGTNFRDFFFDSPPAYLDLNVYTAHVTSGVFLPVRVTTIFSFFFPTDGFCLLSLSLFTPFRAPPEVFLFERFRSDQVILLRIPGLFLPLLIFFLRAPFSRY